MENMKHDILNKGNDIAQDFKGKFQAGEKSLDSMSKDVGERLGTMASGLASSTSDYVKTGRTFVKENPASGVAIAAVAGAMAGCLITLAMTRKQ